MSDSLNELSITFIEDGIEKVKELDKVLLTKGAWATVIYRYQEWVPSKEEYSPVKYSIRRYQKRNDQYWQKSKFNISSEEQARKIVSILNEWLADN